MSGLTLPRARKREKLWLDILDTDICTRIAAHVCNGDQNYNALLLAETTPEMRKAVMSVLSYKVDLFWNCEIGARWSMVAAPHLRSLVISTHPDKPLRDLDPFSTSNPFTLLQIPTIRRAAISDDPAMLWAVKGSSSLRELLVRISRRGGFEFIWGTLSSLNLEKLELECLGKSSYMGDCPNIHLAHYVKSFRLNAGQFGEACPLPAFCPNLSSLRMTCWPVHETNPLGEWLRFFPKLREVTLTSSRLAASDRCADLVNLESVTIIDVHDSFWLAMRLGSMVTMLSTAEQLSGQQIADLSKCPRLTSLDIGLKEGAEQSLAILTFLPKLLSLKLCWSKPTVRIPRNYSWFRGTCSRTSPVPGVLLKVIEQASSLSELHLLNMRIDGKELTSILKHIGPRLQRFETCVCGQDISPFDRLEQIVLTLNRYNPDLRYLGVQEELSWANRDADQLISIQARRIRSSIRRLQRRAPLMDARRLRWHVNALIKDVVLYEPGAKPVNMAQAHALWYAEEPDE